MCTAAQALVHGIVFAIDGQESFTGFVRSGHHQLAGRDENFLVRKSNRLAKFYGFVSGGQPHHTDGSRNDDVCARVHPNCHHASGAVVNLGKLTDSLFVEARSERIRLLRICHRDKFWLVALDLTDKFIDIISRCEGHNAKARRQRIHYAEALAANRACRTKDGKLLQTEILL